MNCRHYRRKLTDLIISHGKPEKLEPAEDAFLSTWKELSDVPAPDILPRLSAQISRDVSSRRSSKSGYYGYLTAAGAVACAALGLFVVTHKNGNMSQDTSVTAPKHSVAAVPQEKLPLSEMLTEVRWRSSEESQVGHEPPSYNEETRSLLLPEKKENK